jgi:ADP-dependent NAD(P)H-hydrate dehydratase
MSSRRPEIITRSLLRDWPLPPPGDDKHDRGTVLAIGGAAATPGALLLTALAALRAGAGVVQLLADPQVTAALAVAVPEAGVWPWPTAATRADFAERLAKSRAVVLGSGLDDLDHAGDLLRLVTEAHGDAALLLDAYALGALSRQPQLAEAIAGPAVLTPNMAEAAILLGREEAGEPARAATDICRRYGAVVALRGYIAAPDGRLWHEDGGDVGLGTAGSGDVLAGLLGGLLASGAEPEQAACWAVHVHAAAGQRLAASVGRTGFLARELLAEVPAILTGI